MKEGLLSVIILSYENSSYVLARAIRSVREQKYRNCEIIVVDANTKDSDYSKGLREDMGMEPDIQLVSCPCRQGEFALAKNSGAEAADGEYLAYLWAGDAWTSKYAKSMIEILKKSPKSGFVFCDSWMSGGDAFSTEYRRTPKNISKRKRDMMRELLLMERSYSLSQIMFRSKVFREMQGFDPYIRGQENCDLFLRIFSKYRILDVKQNLVCRYAEADIGYKSPAQTDATGYLQLYSKHREIYDDNPGGKLLLYKKIAACYSNPRCYGKKLRYVLEIKRLEKKIGNDQKNETKTME